MKTVDFVLIGFTILSLGFGAAAWAKVTALNDSHLIKVMHCVTKVPASVSREEAFIDCERENE